MQALPLLMILGGVSLMGARDFFVESGMPGGLAFVIGARLTMAGALQWRSASRSISA